MPGPIACYDAERLAVVSKTLGKREGEGEGVE